MEATYFKRGFLWTAELIRTLVIFWAKNPNEIPVVLKFILEKVFKSPKFFIRNILLEKQTIHFSKRLIRVENLYNKYSQKFDISNSHSLEYFEKIFNSKFQILYFLIRKLKPKIVVETGVAAGESTGYILKALHDNGKGVLYSIDLPFQWYVYGKNHTLHLDSLPAGKIPGYLIPEKLKKRWVLIIGNTYNKLPKLLKKLGTINIFFHDSEHTQKTMMFEYDTSWPYIKNGGFLISDDVDYTKAFASFSKKIKGKILRFKDLGIIIK